MEVAPRIEEELFEQQVSHPEARRHRDVAVAVKA
jgi:hypothetical protein